MKGTKILSAISGLGLILLFSCKNEVQSISESAVQPQDTLTYTKESEGFTLNSSKPPQLGPLAHAEGKTVSETGIFENPIIEARLKKIAKGDYENYKSHFAQDASFEKSGDFLILNNPDKKGRSVLYIDVKNNLLHGSMKGGVVPVVYTEDEAGTNIPESLLIWAKSSM